MEIGVDTFKVCKRYFLSQDHLVESTYKKCIEESSMEDSQTDHAANKFEVVEMLRINSRVRVDLKGVVVVSGVFEEAVEWVEHFVGQEEEKLSVEQSAKSPVQLYAD